MLAARAIERGPGQPADGRGEDVEDADGRLGAGAERRTRGSAAMRSRGSGSPTGAANRAPAKRLPPAGSSAVRRLMGSAIGMRSTWTSEVLVVAAEPAEQGGQEGVVDRPAGGLARRLEVGEGHVERHEPAAGPRFPASSGDRSDRRRG